VSARTVRRSAGVVVASAALLLAGCSDDDADSVANDAQDQVDDASDRADDLQDDADDLKDDIEQELDEAEGQLDEGLARGQAEIFKQRLTDVGQDDSPSAEVDEWESIAADLPGDPDVSGIEDTDGDGVDDDGKVQISVDDSSACVTVSDASVEVADGVC
jgi:outer membrane murein-binding lipoprotein Lpp